MLAPRLEYVKRWPPENWYMAFQGNLHLLPKSDFLLIEEEMKKLRFGKGYKPALLAPPPDGSRRKKSSSRRRKLRAVGAVAEDGAAKGGNRPNRSLPPGVPAETLCADASTLADPPDGGREHYEGGFHKPCHRFFKAQKRPVLHDLVEELPEVVLVLEPPFGELSAT